MARRTKDEAELTRHAILDAAEKVFYKCGVARTSVEQIASAAAVTRGAVYWHFKDKIEICEAMMNRVFLPQEDILERLASSDSNTPLKDLESACSRSIHMMATDKRWQRVVSIIMLRCEYVDELATMIKRRRKCKDHMLERSERLFERAHKLKQLSPNWSPRMAAIGLQAIMGGLINSMLEGRTGVNFAKAGPECITAFFKSLSATKR